MDKKRKTILVITCILSMLVFSTSAYAKSGSNTAIIGIYDCTLSGTMDVYNGNINFKCESRTSNNYTYSATLVAGAYGLAGYEVDSKRSNGFGTMRITCPSLYFSKPSNDFLSRIDAAGSTLGGHVYLSITS